jgi:hypothetical protein
MRALRCFFASLVLFACSADAGGFDPDDDAGMTGCAEVCDDGDFCNGVERCVAGACVDGEPPCAGELRCDAENERCLSASCETPDADGDGEAAIACGGADCDDSDPDVRPGATEVCDLEGIDEDCDPTTVGERDADGDGAIDFACCNGERCGTDCDDAIASVAPGATEVCNGVDDDCDGSVDEGVLRVFFPDVDRDGFGDRRATPTAACVPTEGFVENALDCDDTNAGAAPGNLELCNGLDDDCNGVVDDADRTALTCASSFGTPPRTFFGCEGGACVVDACVEGFADCNGERSDGCEVDTRSDVEHCGACGDRCGAGGTCEASVCDRVIDVSAGYEHGCALRSSGRIVCWGANRYAQLGDGTTSPRAIPIVLPTPGDAIDVEVSRFPTVVTAGNASGEFSCALTPWLVWCWGANLSGEIVASTSSIVAVPRTIDGLPRLDRNLTQMPLRDRIALGGRHGMVEEDTTLGADSMVSWSTPAYGIPGDFTGFPTTVDGPVDRAWVGGAHTCGLTIGTNRTHCVGRGGAGQLGDGTTVVETASPVAVSGGHTFTELSLGQAFSCGLRTDGRVLCWGLNQLGQLGDGSNTQRNAPVLVSGLDSVTQLSAGFAHVCALRGDGTVWCWGDDANGQLGDGSVGGARSTPAQVVGLTDVEQVSAGGTFTCALRTDGDVWCWGGNRAGQLARGVTGDATGTASRATEL